VKRIKALLNKFSQYKIDAFLIESQSNKFYLTGKEFEGFVLISFQGVYIISDARFSEELLSQKKFGVIITPFYFKELRKLIKKLKISHLGFEEKILAFKGYEILKECVKRMVPLQNILEEMRMIKDKEEIETIRESIRIISKCLEFIQEIISPGKTEKELASQLIRFMLLMGASNYSFFPIVLSGKNTSLPHGRPGNKKILLNEPILIDIGAKFRGYCSDLTRIFYLGRIPLIFKENFKLVKEAQDIAFKMIKPGMKISSIEKRVRDFFKKYRKNKFFLHSLGHGIGIDVHEHPFISQYNDLELREGMVFTIEPALYFAGKFGIRIEDIVLVNKRGVQVLSDYIHKSI